MPTSRVQFALNVADLQSAVKFYVDLFGVDPHKQHPGYANFSITEPPLKLVLIENPGAAGALNHLGVELAVPDDVTAATKRFNQLGLSTRSSEQERCCHAVQHKVYVTAPEVPLLSQWEFYTVLDDNPDDSLADAAETCCPSSPTGEAPCCV